MEILMELLCQRSHESENLIFAVGLCICLLSAQLKKVFSTSKVIKFQLLKSFQFHKNYARYLEEYKTSLSKQVFVKNKSYSRKMNIHSFILMKSASSLTHLDNQIGNKSSFQSLLEFQKAEWSSGCKLLGAHPRLIPHKKNSRKARIAHTPLQRNECTSDFREILFK